MCGKVDTMYLDAKIRWEQFADRLLHEEKGASDIVAIMVVIVILLAVAVVFKGQLEGLVSAVFGKATDWVNSN